MIAVDEIIDVAKYLRGVRPLDPAELIEYVTVDVSESDVRDVLRAQAVDLEIAESKDGTFGPVKAQVPLTPAGIITGLPDEMTRTLIQELESTYGESWPHGDSGDTLRGAIRSFKSAYFSGDAVRYDRSTALGYAIYHLPGAFAKIQYVLDHLGTRDLLPPALRVLEVGPGVGGSAIGLREYIGAANPIAYRGIEPSEPAADLCEQFLANYERNFHWSIDRTRIEDARLDGPYDLIVLANVINELSNPTAALTPLIEELSHEGSLLALEPADKQTSRSLRRVERSLLDSVSDVDVYAPTLRLWPELEPSDDCWSFDVQAKLDLPRFQRQLDEGRRAIPDDRDPATGEFSNVEVQYAYTILRKDGQRINDFRPSRKKFAPLRTAEEQVGDRVNLCIVKLSHSLAGDDRHPLYVIGDGSQRTRHFAVHTAETELNTTLSQAPYGALLAIEGGLVLWNDDEAAHNIVIDQDSVVDRIPP